MLGIQDEIVILRDSTVNNPATISILDAYPYRQCEHQLNNDNGSHKNYGIDQCKNQFIFQLDADELPPDSLIGENLHNLIESNPNTDAYAVPRINAWIGLTKEHAKQWQWSLDVSPTYQRLRAAFPDYQLRIFANAPSIRFKNRLHERIEGYKHLSVLPPDEEYALYHDKTIETQVTTNQRYNKDFTEKENKGIRD